MTEEQKGMGANLMLAVLIMCYWGLLIWVGTDGIEVLDMVGSVLERGGFLAAVLA